GGTASDGESVPAETTTTAAGTTAAPIRCLDAAGLSAAGEKAVGVWSGRHVGPAYAILVRRLAKPAKAPHVAAGESIVTGSFKVSALGTGLTDAEGLEADALVQEVADCLGG